MEKNKGTLRVYMERDEDGVDLFVVERINPFNHSFKKAYFTEDGLCEGV